MGTILPGSAFLILRYNAMMFVNDDMILWRI